ncbi:MAG: SGNH/GDSL hydrolase family protein [Proteobacteria bacterium]|nr:SGNH/GDSL hydrolase family protein [Pseudomonadota bacterium]
MDYTTQPARLSFKTKLFLALFGLVISALMLEVAFRVLAPGLKPKRWSDRPYAYFIPSDSRTLQDRSPHPKEPGTFRILVVGDSFTFGPHLQLNDTFPKKLEQMLNLNPAAPRVEVINRGVCGVSTEVEVELVREALKEQPDLLVLEITLNDAETLPLTKAKRAELFDAPWMKWRIFTIWRSLGFVAQRLHNYQTVGRHIEYYNQLFKNPQTLQQFDTALSRIAILAKGAQVPILAMVFPLFDFPVNNNYPFHEVHTVIQKSLAAHAITEVDLLMAYKNIPPERLQVIPGIDNHPNEIAHRIAAERLLAVLADRRYLPETVLPSRIFRQRKGLRSKSSPGAAVWSRAAHAVAQTSDHTDN